MTFTSNYLVCAGREIHYTEWGAGHGETVIAWHGLARTGRDFDDIAAVLGERYRVICPDTVGRGLSEWSVAPEAEYCLAYYAQSAVALVDALGIDRMHWIGTSMGGAVGMLVAAGALKARLRSLVLNDIGPALGAEAVRRIRAYAGNPPQFARASELEAFFRTVYAPFGPLAEVQWRRLAQTSTRRMPDGKVTPHYDPNMVLQFERHPHDYELWETYDAIAVPTLCLRGEHSDLLLAETAEEMQRRGPRARVVTVAGVGHAPALNVPEQIGILSEFLAAQA
jgi:pimeloyl-ACP methyl ester carboxylesterase